MLGVRFCANVKPCSPSTVAIDDGGGEKRWPSSEGKVVFERISDVRRLEGLQWWAAHVSWDAERLNLFTKISYSRT